MPRLSPSLPRGFTLIELLVVIAIIGLLSSVVLAALNTARNKARVAAAKQEISQIAKAVEAARIMSGKQYLKDITGSNCTRCNASPTTALQTAMQNISNASGTFGGLEAISKDPWGSLYSLDENEGEGGSTNCIRDTLVTTTGLVNYRFEYGSEYCKAHPAGVAGFY